MTAQTTAPKTKTATPRAVSASVAASATRPFRRDIQGLRAVAVVLVLLGHAGVPGVAGGFIGVDVFFVISGFLISGHLTESLLRNGRIDFARFYASRARRILPASGVVVALTAAAAFLLVSPLRLEGILKEAVASALYFPNIHFAIEGTDYLAGTEPSPFQHFWSLGVEEQFYLFWPLLLLGLFLLTRRKPGRLPVGIAVVTIASFVACLVVADVSQPWAFFSLPTRAWELGVGALVACCPALLARVSDRFARPLSWAGLVLIGASAFAFTSETVYPGPLTLIPVIGAALVIGFGGRPAATVSGSDAGATRLLGLRPFQFVGAISYSLYLVHWPVLVLVHEKVGLLEPLPLVVALPLMIASVPLAYALYRFVETPLRASGSALQRPRRTLAVSVVASLVLAAALAGSGSASAMMPERSSRSAGATDIARLPSGTDFVPSGVDPTLSKAAEDTGELYTNGCQQSPDASEVHSCAFGDPNATVDVALFGDSHAGRWFPAMKEATLGLGAELHTYTKSKCRSVETDVMWDDAENASCSAWRKNAIAALVADPPDVIVLANHLGPISGKDPVKEQRDWEQGVAHTLERLPPQSRIVTLASTPQFKTSPVFCLAENLDDAGRCAVPRDNAFNMAIDSAQSNANERAGSAYVDMTDFFCNDSSCPAVIGSTLVYSDEHHMSATFSRLLGPSLEKKLAPYLTG